MSKNYYYTDKGTMEITVGKIFPIPRRAIGDGSRVEYFDGQGPSLLMYYSNLREKEIAAVNEDVIYIAMSQIETAVWFVFRIGDGDVLVTDCPLNPKYYSYDLRDFPLASCFKIFLVDTDTNVLKAIREIPLPIYFQKRLKEAVANAYQSDVTIEEYPLMLDYINNKFTPQDLFNNAHVKMMAEPIAMLRMKQEMEKKIPTDRFLYNDELDIYQLYIDRATVESENIEKVENLLWNLIRKVGYKGCESKISIGFSGYVGDVREVFEVPEICAFLQKLDAKFPFWFYVISLKTDFLKTLTYCLTGAEMINYGTLKRNNVSIAKFMENHYIALNYLGEQIKIDTDPVSYAVTDYYTNTMLEK